MTNTWPSFPVVEGEQRDDRGDEKKDRVHRGFLSTVINEKRHLPASLNSRSAEPKIDNVTILPSAKCG